MRNAIVHFDEWSRGEGKFGPQKDRRDAGVSLRDIAREFSGFGYDPLNSTVSLGPYTISVHTADDAAGELMAAIADAAHEIDRKHAAETRAHTIEALAAADIPHNVPDAPVRVSSGHDLRIWLTLDPASNLVERDGRGSAERIVAALASRGLELATQDSASTHDAVQSLMLGNTVRVADAPHPRGPASAPGAAAGIGDI